MPNNRSLIRYNVLFRMEKAMEMECQILNLLGERYLAEKDSRGGVGPRKQI